MPRPFAPLVILVLSLLPAPAGADEPPGEAPPARAEEPKPSEAPAPTLDDLMVEAMRSNPDILVAEAKVRQAQAELNQARLRAAQAVLEARAQAARLAAVARDMREQEELARRRHAAGQVSADEVARLRAQVADLDAAKAEIEARLQYLRGGGAPSGAAAGGVGGAAGPQQGPPTLPAELRHSWVAAVEAEFLGRSASRVRREPAVPEALDRPVSVQFRDTMLRTVLEHLQAHGRILLLLDQRWGSQGRETVLSQHVTLAPNGALPLRAVLEALADTIGAQFVPRSYGGLFVPQGPEFEPGASPSPR